MQKIGFQSVFSSAVVTLPSALSYTAGYVMTSSDSAGKAMTFSSAGRFNGSTGAVGSALCICSQNATVKPDIELWVFAADSDADADLTNMNNNSAFVPTDTDLSKCVGVIDFPLSTWKVGNAGSGTDGNCINVVSGVDLLYRCSLLASSLFAYAVVRNAYDCLEAETLRFILGISLD